MRAASHSDSSGRHTGRGLGLVGAFPRWFDQRGLDQRLPPAGCHCDAYLDSPVRRQAQASDFSSYLQLTERYANAWRAFRDAEPGAKKEFEFGEVLNLIEGTCHLYNSGAIHGATQEMIRDYLREVLPAVFSDEFAKERIAQSFSGPDTYLHIRRFSRNNSIEGVPWQ